MFLHPESLLECVEAMTDDQLSRFLMTLARADGLRELRALFVREAQAAVLRALPAQSLLDCIANMSVEQRTRFCELLDPVKPEAIEAELGAQGPPFTPGGAYLARLPEPFVNRKSLIVAATDVKVQTSLDSPAGLLAKMVEIRGVRRDDRVHPGPGPIDWPVDLGQSEVRMADVVAPKAVFQQFMRRYGDVCKAAGNHLRLSWGDPLSDLHVHNCVISVAGPGYFTAAGGDMMHVAHMIIIATRVSGAGPAKAQERREAAVGIPSIREVLSVQPLQSADVDRFKLAVEGPPHPVAFAPHRVSFECVSTPQFARRVIPPLEITNDELDRSICADESVLAKKSRLQLEQEKVRREQEQLNDFLRRQEQALASPGILPYHVIDAVTVKELDDKTKNDVLRNGWAEPLPTRVVGEATIEYSCYDPTTVLAGDVSQLLADNARQAMAEETMLQERWQRAQERWKRLFNEPEIPLIYLPETLTSTLDAIEAILYDKETAGINPARCKCGCGFIIGCEAKVHEHFNRR